MVQPDNSTRRGIACLRTRRGGVNDPAGLIAWRPVGIRRAGGWLCPVGAPMTKKHPSRGERLSHTIQRTRGDYPSKETLLPSVANGSQAGPVLSPGYVRRSEDRLCEPQCRRLAATEALPVAFVPMDLSGGSRSTTLPAPERHLCCLSPSCGPFCPPGYVRRSEDRFCEPQFRRLYLRRQRERQPRLGSGKTHG